MQDSDTIIPLRKRERKTWEWKWAVGRKKYNRKKSIIGIKQGTKYKNVLHPPFLQVNSTEG